MNPMFIVAIPIVLVIIGMVLNSTGLSFDQPPSSRSEILQRGARQNSILTAVSSIYRENKLAKGRLG
jgi:hypothetical protein